MALRTGVVVWRCRGGAAAGKPTSLSARTATPRATRRADLSRCPPAASGGCSRTLGVVTVTLFRGLVHRLVHRVWITLWTDV